MSELAGRCDRAADHHFKETSASAPAVNVMLITMGPESVK